PRRRSDAGRQGRAPTVAVRGGLCHASIESRNERDSRVKRLSIWSIRSVWSRLSRHGSRVTHPPRLSPNHPISPRRPESAAEEKQVSTDHNQHESEHRTGQRGPIAELQG